MQEQKLLPINQLELNLGQIDGVPPNPRIITDERYDALKKSISELPDMMQLREPLVYPLKKGKYIVLCGNQRLTACKELGWAEMPCKIIPKDTPAETLRRIAMIDNEGFGKTDWDAITLDWDVEELKDWGVEVKFTEQLDAGNEQDLDSKGEIDVDQFEEKQTLKLDFMPDEYLFVMGKLREYGDDLSSSLLLILGYKDDENDGIGE